jgi:uncharacterized protein (DUF4213/DUF364 family)
MTVLENLINSICSSIQDAPVSQVLAGVHWTAVCSRNTGLAATWTDASCCRSRDVDHAGHLEQRSAFELCNLLFSSHPLEVSIGMAALNSINPVDVRAGVELNARDLLLERSRQKNVVVIGHFPFVDALRKTARQLWVLELDPAPGEYPASAAPELIPRADIVGITATTLMNQTFEGLYPLFPPHALVVMMGPSTPLNPVLFDYGINVLAGSLVAQPDLLMPYLRQGTTLHKVEGLRRFTLAKEPGTVSLG